MKFRAWLGAMAALLAPLAASAFVPESGFYQQFTPDNTASTGGTGIAIEIQNEYMFAAGYVFTPAGVPTFVTMQGFLSLQTDGTWTLSTSASDPSNGLAAYSSGQCIGTAANCPYKKPTATKIGDFGIQFKGEDSAALSWGATGNIASTTLRRFHYYSGPEHTGYESTSLLGQWDILIAHGVAADGLGYEGDRLAFGSSTSADSSGNTTVSGCISNNDGTPSCMAGYSMIAYATPCVGPLCLGKSHYDIVISNSASQIVRVYSFDSNNAAGAFTQNFYGTAKLCPSGQTTIAACNTTTVHFNAYRSGSAQYVQSTAGMHQP